MRKIIIGAAILLLIAASLAGQQQMKPIAPSPVQRVSDHIWSVVTGRLFDGNMKCDSMEALNQIIVARSGGSISEQAQRETAACASQPKRNGIANADGTRWQLMILALQEVQLLKAQAEKEMELEQRLESMSKRLEQQSAEIEQLKQMLPQRPRAQTTAATN